MSRSVNLKEVSMIRTILVPASGSSTDQAVFVTALAAARPCSAHLQFYHLRVAEDVAALRTPHFDFCVGSGLTSALEKVRQNVTALSAQADAHVRSFCGKHELPVHANFRDKTWCLLPLGVPWLPAGSST
jgi:hypothetical protein